MRYPYRTCETLPVGDRIPLSTTCHLRNKMTTPAYNHSHCNHTSPSPRLLRHQLVAGSPCHRCFSQCRFDQTLGSASITATRRRVLTPSTLATIAILVRSQICIGNFCPVFQRLCCRVKGRVVSIGASDGKLTVPGINLCVAERPIFCRSDRASMLIGVWVINKVISLR